MCLLGFCKFEVERRMKEDGSHQQGCTPQEWCRWLLHVLLCGTKDHGQVMIGKNILISPLETTASQNWEQEGTLCVGHTKEILCAVLRRST